MLSDIVQPPDLVAPQDQSNVQPIRGFDDTQFHPVNVTLTFVKHGHDFDELLFGTNKLLWWHSLQHQYHLHNRTQGYTMIS